MMDKREEQLALELDAFLTARQKGQPTPLISAELAAECQLADDLLNLANDTEMNHSFLSDLEAQLMAAASAASRSPQNKLTPPRTAVRKRPSVWGELIKQIEELFTMKKITYAVGAVMAMLMIGFVVWSVWPGGDEPEMVVERTDLPRLPAISAGAAGMGGGGGGAEMSVGEPMIVEDAMMIDPEIGRWWDPFVEAEYELALELPAGPSELPVYAQPASGRFSLEEANRFAALFGFTGGGYVEVYPRYDDEIEWTPPTYYNFFDGPRHLAVSDAHLYYTDNSLMVYSESDQMPFERAAPIAEAFLRERGLLNFEYEIIKPIYDNYAVEFRRTVDGRVINSPYEFQVQVSSNGQVRAVSHTPLNALETLGSYPLRSAADAWQLLLDEGIDYRRVFFNIFPGPDYVMPVYSEPAIDWNERYRYWERAYDDGDMVSLYPYVMVYLPTAEGGLPRIQIDRYQLLASPDDLWAIAERPGMFLYVKGIHRELEYGAGLELLEWRPVEEVDYRFYHGAIDRSGDEVLLRADDGETFIIPNAPADLPDGERVYVSGPAIETTEDGRQLFNWSGIGRLVEDETMFEEWDPVEETDPNPIRLVTVNDAVLIYATSYVFESHTEPPRLIVQPVWRFTATTNTNEIVEFFIQAVPDEFVEQE